MKTGKIMGLLMIAGSILITGSCISAQNENPISAQNENLINGPKVLPGGKIARANDYYVELVFLSNDTSHVYLFDKSAKPVSPIAITGRIVFQQYDSTTSAFDLVHAKAEGFVALTTIPAYKRCDIYFEVKGEPVSARFNAEEGLASRPYPVR